MIGPVLQCPEVAFLSSTNRFCGGRTNAVNWIISRYLSNKMACLRQVGSIHCLSEADVEPACRSVKSHVTRISPGLADTRAEFILYK